jgi:hypothetical protein
METSMVDFLFASGQGLCVVWLLYGAYLSIIYAPQQDRLNTWINFDPMTTHARYSTNESLEDRLRRAGL